MMYNWIFDLYSDHFITEEGTGYLFIKIISRIILLIIYSAIIWGITRRILLTITIAAAKTKTKWDDALVENKFFRISANVVPALFIDYSIPEVFEEQLEVIAILMKLTDLIIIIALLRVVISFINASKIVLSEKKMFKDKPITSYLQLVKIIIYFIFGIIAFSLLLNKSPLYFLSAMGAMTAVLLLIFKDTILGFVASIQIAALDLVRNGDWVSMPKYGADGDVFEINLTSIKVRNFDKTITTVPTYAFTSDSFKNWRGMNESQGRRIKRALSISITSVKFCDDALLKKMEKIQLLDDFLGAKRSEIITYNESNQVDTESLVNGRHLTNLGVFRIYAEEFLKNNPQINTNLTCMVRQLSPTEVGVPLEIYAFISQKEWVAYEKIVSDVFDHLLASINEFDLEIYQSPTGKDLSALVR